MVHKGQAVLGTYIALECRLRVFTVAPNGTEATLYFIDPGETCVLALNCLFNDLLYAAWVQAETPATVAVIAGPVCRLMAELEQVRAGQHKVRLAQFILTHADSDGTLLMTQQQIAGHLGTTREVGARLIGDFVDAELLRTRHGALAIRDPFGLRRVVASDPGKR